MIDSGSINTELKGRYSNKMTVDRPGFQKDTLISTFEETAIYSDPIDRSNTDQSNVDEKRMTTKRYNDTIYVKKTDPVSIPNNIKSSTNNNEV